MWSVSDFTCVLLFLQKRQDICNRHGWTHPITSVSIFIVYGLASRALRCAVIIERYEPPTTRDSLLTSAILFTQDRRGGCVHIHALWTHTARFKVVHLSWFVCSSALCPLATLLVRVNPIGHEWSFDLTYAWKHTVSCALVVMSVFIGSLLTWKTLLSKLRWIGAVCPPPGIRCWQQQYCAHKTAEVVVCTFMHCGHTQYASRWCSHGNV